MFADRIIELVKTGKIKHPEVLINIRRSRRMSIGASVIPIVDETKERLLINENKAAEIRKSLALGAKLPFDPMWLEFPWANGSNIRIGVYLRSIAPNHCAGDVYVELKEFETGEGSVYQMQKIFEWRTDETGIGGTHHNAICNSATSEDKALLKRLGHFADGVPSAASFYSLITLNLLNSSKQVSGHPGVPEKSKLVKGTIQKGLSYTVLKFNLGEKTPKQAVRHLLYTIRKRLHDVRGHWRVYNPNECPHEWVAREPSDAEIEAGNVIERQHCTRCTSFRVWIAEHERGDEKIGRVIHDYEITKKEKKAS